MPKRVLFVCIENSGRSQMAEAFVQMTAQGIIRDDVWKTCEPLDERVDQLAKNIRKTDASKN
jgi:protein-tyrosine-phosphatase